MFMTGGDDSAQGSSLAVKLYELFTFELDQACAEASLQV